eukprot:CAMPEP_0185805478 /NCGR_PEP_ID=MMETSP1322-20130828/3879_1 /TAXON_ID=265543 /ORGANISM="Minutocellus polymorphus, Strain RCC2270" /LENGTH=287 /DNA_ID=CAMNT_0028501517 /DNA_START=350 /DNA_END=1216 /DNA_ORIENTATION=+
MGKKAQAGKPKKLTPKDVGKRLNALAKNLEEELKGADLFAPLPPTEDCAICFVPISPIKSGRMYKTCCGKEICWACYKENKESINKQNEEKSAGKKLALTCPFCREPNPTADEEEFARLQARCLQNDHIAFALMGDLYRDGTFKAPKDDLKAIDCWIQAIELGSAGSCARIAEGYNEGKGVAFDKGRAFFLMKIGALRGEIVARYNIGRSEYHTFGNHEIGIRHWKIAAEAGHQDSLNNLRDIYNADGKVPGREFITKEYLDFAYRACHEAQMEVTSEEREKHRSEE